MEGALLVDGTRLDGAIMEGILMGGTLLDGTLLDGTLILVVLVNGPLIDLMERILLITRCGVAGSETGSTILLFDGRSLYRL